jgi:peptide/nickel transport system permease protein
VTAWLVRRLAASIAIVFAVVTLTFLLLHLMPGRPFMPPEGRFVDSAATASLRERFGLDQPPVVQYARYLTALLHGDLGYSYYQRRPVTSAIADALPNTLLLAAVALVLDLGLGLLLGVYQAAHAGRPSDTVLGQISLFFYSVPIFWLALVLLLVFGEWLRWFPVGGTGDPVICPVFVGARCVVDRLWHLVLPAATLGLVGVGGTARYQRAALLEVLSQDFIRAARAKGLSERRVVLVHALRNALLPFITLFGLTLPFFLTGAVLVETVFAFPGIGKLAADALSARDYPLVSATTLYAGILVVSGSLIADLLYVAADPRIRVTEAAA